MHISKVKPRRIVTERIDPDYYHPQHLSDEDRLQEFGSEKLGKTGKFFVGPFGSKLPSFLYMDRGIPLFRISNIGSMDVTLSGMAYLNPAIHEKLSASEVLPGDLLIVKASVGEKICRVPETIPKANITQHIIALRPNGRFDIDYIAAFLFCDYGKRQLIRRSLGSIIQYLGVQDSKTVLFPKLDNLAQTYIGNKVRQAERLRERSRELEDNFQDAIKEKFPEIFGDVKARGRHSWAKLENSTLNAGAYQPERLRIRGYLKENGGKQVKYIATIETPVTSNYSSSDIYIGLDAISSSSSKLTPSTIGESEVEGSARILLEGVAISKLRPYLNKVTYVPPELARSLGSTELLCIQPKALSISSWFLYGVLKLESSIRQLNPVSTGSTHPRVSREDVLDLMVPWLENSKFWGNQLENAQKGYFLSEQLTTATKILVEALIEGNLKEAELKAAQEALQQGDNSLDREILSRLTRKGYNISGELPLFPDLDALFKVLKDKDEGYGI